MLSNMFNGFLRAAIRPSRLATGGAIVVAALLLVASCLLFTEKRVSELKPGALMLNERDEYAYLTSQVLHIAHADKEKLSVLVFGDSAIREAITDEKDL